MEDIIAETKMSKGGVYYYYKNKEDICLNLMCSVTEKYHDLSRNIPKMNVDEDPIKNVCNYYLDILTQDIEEIKIISTLYIDTRHDIEFQKKIQKWFEGSNEKIISDYIFENIIIEDKELFHEKLGYFLELFHALLYYKYIDSVNYPKRKNEVRQTFYDIFKDVERHH